MLNRSLRLIIKPWQDQALVENVVLRGSREGGDNDGGEMGLHCKLLPTSIVANC